MSRAWSLRLSDCSSNNVSTKPLHVPPSLPTPTGPMSADGSLGKALIPATCEEEDEKRRRGRQPGGGLLKALSLPMPWEPELGQRHY